MEKSSEKMKPGKDFIGVGCGAFIVNKKNEFLMMLRSENCKNEKGKWNIPGGAIDFNEKAADAIKREVKEEIGIDIDIIDVVNYIDHILSDEKQHWFTTTFLAKIVSGEPKIMEEHKFHELKWFSLEKKLPENLAMTASIAAEDYKKKFLQ